MRAILFLLRKEFLQIFRHRIMLPLIFVMPIVQLLILANAADYEVKNIRLHVVDRNLSAPSRHLISKFEASPYFEITGASFDVGDGYAQIEAGRADLFLDIPPQFDRQMWREGPARVQLIVDAINGVKAGIIGGYAQSIIRDFGAKAQTEWLNGYPEETAGVGVTFSYWYNPHLEYHHFMVPGILVILVTLVGMFLSGMNIVKEKEIGTIEQINVSPIRKHQFIIGKLLPFWIIALVELAVGLWIGKLVFDIPIEGSLGLVFGFAAVYLLTVLGLGLLISTVTRTQQQSMFIAWFVLIIFILMSGLFTPIESMPEWARRLTRLNPVAYFVDVMRLVLLKGSGIFQVRNHFLILILYGLVVNTLAVWTYRKQTS